MFMHMYIHASHYMQCTYSLHAFCAPFVCNMPQNAIHTVAYTHCTYPLIDCTITILRSIWGCHPHTQETLCGTEITFSCTKWMLKAILKVCLAYFQWSFHASCLFSLFRSMQWKNHRNTRFVVEFDP